MHIINDHSVKDVLMVSISIFNNRKYCNLNKRNFKILPRMIGHLYRIGDDVLIAFLKNNALIKHV